MSPRRLIVSVFAFSLLVESAGAIAQSVISRTERNREAIRFTAELVDGDLVYDGKLSEEGVAKIISLHRSTPVKPVTLVIRSTGGSSYAGLVLGRYVFDFQLTVRVVDYCGSSCANYVFPAGRRKLIDRGSVIWWHGSMASRSWEIPGTTERHTCRSKDACGAELAAVVKDKFRCKSAATCTQEKAEVMRFFEVDFEPLKRNEREFFELIGVDASLATYGNDTVACNCVWTFDLSDLRKFGVYNVTVEAGRHLKETAESKATLKEAIDKVKLLSVK